MHSAGEAYHKSHLIESATVPTRTDGEYKTIYFIKLVLKVQRTLQSSIAK